MTTVVADGARLLPRALDIERANGSTVRALLECQQGDGHWVFELEADATIPAEYVLLRHYRGEPRDESLEKKIASYLRRIQGKHSGWPLYHQGDFDMSASVKAYFALKMTGDSPDAPHMRQAREAILARGGAVHCNVFTRALLSLYGILAGAACPRCQLKLCCCRAGFRSICRKCHIGRALCWCRCWFCRHCARAQKSAWRQYRRTVCRTAAFGWARSEGPAPALGLVCPVSRRRFYTPTGRQVFSKKFEAARHRSSRCLRYRAA